MHRDCSEPATPREGDSAPPEARAEMMRYGWDPVSDKKLTEFLNRNMEALAKMLVEMGVLSEVPDHIPQLS